MNIAQILVIEDNPGISDIIRYILTEMSSKEVCVYKISLAYDGKQGLERVEELHPDIILLDIHMPRMNGYEVLQSLRSRDITTPVIMMTAVVRPEEQAKAFRAGCDAYLTKPFTALQLSHLVREQLHRKALQPAATP
ncbi:MAG TPA: response regulator [Ktedonosporobacter sp.]|nr:response regulator [Ktedonosporobacter sp.]